ncbi:MAG TPA: hypothetical protein VMA72_08630 [Streptosporangiaceae bacterium]|nr:hypothetical protein [Streptosporangiaceae bacterium]
MQLTQRMAAVATAAGVVLALSTTGVGEAAPSSSRPAQPAGATARYTLQIIAINRAGHHTAIQPTVASVDGVPVATSRQTVKIPAGRYLVGAAIATPIPGQASPSYTLVAKEVRVTRSRTVTLDARTGRLLKVAFNARGARQVVQGATLCGTSPGAMLAGVYSDPTGTTYVAPVPKAVRLFYQSRWQSAAGTLYELAGSAARGSKAAPHFSDRVSRLARVRLELRSGTNAAGPQGGFALAHGPDCGPGGDILPVSAPWAATSYLQAGPWSGVIGIGARTLYWSGKFRTRHRYTVSLGSAVYGPWLPFVNGELFPKFDRRTLAFGSDGFFSDPAAIGSDCAVHITSTLLKGRATLKRLRQDGCSQTDLDKRVAKSGWYRLRVVGSQRAALSSRVTVTWRFYLRTGPQLSWPRAVPVTLTGFRPQGLDLANSALPGALTRIAVTIKKGAFPDSRAPRNVVRTIRIEASFDGGKTWQAVKLTRRGSRLSVEVRDPASGTVSLRSTVVNTAGDSTVLTVYNAYGVRQVTSST